MYLSVVYVQAWSDGSNVALLMLKTIQKELLGSLALWWKLLNLEISNNEKFIYVNALWESIYTYVVHHLLTFDLHHFISFIIMACICMNVVSNLKTKIYMMHIERSVSRSSHL